MGTTGKVTLTLKKSRKHDQIIRAALNVFSLYGLNGASMDQIALEAEMSKSNIFYYFSGKEELYEHVLQCVITEWLAPLSGITVDRDPQEALAEYIETKLYFSKKMPEASRVFAMEVIQGAPYLKPLIKGQLKKIVKEKLIVIDQWIAEGKLSAVSGLHLIFSIWSITQHYADFAAQIEGLTGKTLSNKVFYADTVATIQHILLNGVLPREGVVGPAAAALAAEVEAEAETE